MSELTIPEGDSCGPPMDRRAGVLLHITSLPDGPGNGDLGPGAYRFVDLLSACGLRVWQMLPVGPTHENRSPYQTLSVHAGDPTLISLERLVEEGWLEPAPVPEGLGDEWLAAREYRRNRLQEARGRFGQLADAARQEEYQAFLAAQSHWLDDYALFQSLKDAYHDTAWWDWPQPLRDRDPEALEEACRILATPVDQQRFQQFLFFRQWQALKHYANQRDILFFGDMPIFVADDSADVWAHRGLFALDADGRPELVAGVPPDYFSATGQRWGNPHYRWEALQAQNFDWWVERMATQLSLNDLVRIDHFRGFEAYWAIPASEPTAVHGRWVKAPGVGLFERLQREFDPLPVVAEDLGVITPEVEALRRRFALPGMKILQFAFGSGPENPYLPHHHLPDFAVYTGTHDNDTTLGWYQDLEPRVRDEVLEYLGGPDEPMPWPLVRAAFASVGCLAVVPMQDLLSLGKGQRMNTPGTTHGNWSWRFSWQQIPADLAGRVSRLAELYGRR